MKKGIIFALSLLTASVFSAPDNALLKSSFERGMLPVPTVEKAPVIDGFIDRDWSNFTLLNGFSTDKKLLIPGCEGYVRFSRDKKYLYIGVTTSTPSTAPGGSPWGDLVGSLFPFLSPDETESEPGDATEEPDATVTKNPCADGHDYEPQLEREASCYAVSIHRLVCRDCGRSKKERGDEILPHVYEDGYCTGCGLVEGAHPIESCTFQYTKNCGLLL